MFNFSRSFPYQQSCSKSFSKSSVYRELPSNVEHIGDSTVEVLHETDADEISEDDESEIPNVDVTVKFCDHPDARWGDMLIKFLLTSISHNLFDTMATMMNMFVPRQLNILETTNSQEI